MGKAPVAGVDGACIQQHPLWTESCFSCVPAALAAFSQRALFSLLNPVDARCRGSSPGSRSLPVTPQLLHGQCLAERLPPPAPGCAPDPAWAAAAAPRWLSKDEGKGQSASALHAAACGYPVPQRLQGPVPGPAPRGHGALRGADTVQGNSRSFICLQSARSVPLPTALPLLSGYSETGAPSHSCGFPRDHLRGVTAGCCCPRAGLPRVSPREAAPSSRRSGGRSDEGGRSDTQTWIVALPSPGGKAGRSGLGRAVLGCCSSQEMGDLVQRLLTNTPA